MNEKSFYLILFILLCSGIAAAQNTAIDENADTEKYYQYWTEIFKERNHFSIEDFNTHILVENYSIISERSGDSFEVKYIFNNGWVSVERTETAIIRPAVSGIRLNKDYMKQRSSSDYKYIKVNVTLAFATYEDAKVFIKEYTGKDSAFGYEYIIGVGTPSPWGDGQIYMDYQAGNETSCVQGRLNLYTKDIEVWSKTCEKVLEAKQKTLPKEEIKGVKFVTCPLITEPTSGWCKYGEIETEKDNDNCTKTYKCMHKLSNGKKAEIKLMPETASAKAIEKLGNLGFNITLKEVGKDNSTRSVYEYKAEKDGRLFWIFKVKGEVSADVDANTGEIVSVKKPWWAFLASKI